MKTPSNLLKTINTIFNILWYTLLGFSVLLIPIVLFLPPVLPIKFTLKEQGKFTTNAGETFDLLISEANGIADFTSGFTDFSQGNFINPLFYIISFIVVLILCLFLFFQLKKLINDVYKGIVFKEKGHLRLRYIGYTLLILTATSFVDFFLLQTYCTKYITHPAITLDTDYDIFSDFDWNSFIGGLIFLVLSEVFKEGFALKQETELTI